MTTPFATPADVLVTRRMDTADAKYLAALERYLEDATEDVIAALGFSFNRSPETGVETWTATGDGQDTIHFHDGVAALDTLELRYTATDDWIALDGSDWVLEYDLGNPSIPAGEPAFHAVLLPGGSYSAFPGGRQLVRFTGARGWTTVPIRARSMVVAIVRQRLGLDQTGQGGTFGPEEFGGRVGPDLWPKAAYDTLQLEKGRHRACSL